MEKQLQNFIQENKQRFLNELFDFLRIPSVSANPENTQDMLNAAQFLQDKLKIAGCDIVEIIQTEGHPIVYAEKIIDVNLPTVLVYGHYDVQPAEPLELWKTPPFEPTVINDIIYARGADDDKGQMFTQVKALEFMTTTNNLPCNIKFLIEGEEEAGSSNIGTFVKQNKEKLKADVIIASDTSMIANDVPSINVGLRGLCYFQIELTGPDRDLHSGVYGGGVPNPANILCKMLNSLFDENNKVNIPGFYDDVYNLTEKEREALNSAPFSLEDYKDEISIKNIYGEKGYTTEERTTARPALDINGIWSGYTGEGAKTVIPSKAYAKISTRLVPFQNPQIIKDIIINHLKNIAPDSVHIDVEYLHGGDAYMSPTDGIEFQAASMAFEKTFNKKPIPTRSGGSIPIVALFEKELGVKTILMGWGLESDAIHSPNEHFGIFNFIKGIETIPYFFKYYTELKK